MGVVHAVALDRHYRNINMNLTTCLILSLVDRRDKVSRSSSKKP